MTFEIEFAGSEIEEIVVSKAEMEIRFASFVVVTAKSDSGLKGTKRVSGSLKITGPKFKTLPVKGVLSDGELYGVAGKALNGRLAANFRSEKGVELMLADAKGEHSIHGKGIEVLITLLEIN